MTRKKNRKKTIENIHIDKIGYGGVGIGKLENGKKIIIKGGALPGSIVDIRITRNRKDLIQGHITKIHKLDPEYSDGTIFCPHYFTNIEKNIQDNDQNLEKYKIGCGGCKRQIMKYEKQLELKEKIVLENFKNIISEQGTDFLNIVGSPLQKNYRNKIEFSFGKYLKRFYKDSITGEKNTENLDKIGQREVESHWNLGFHKQGEFSKIVDIDSCGLASDNVNQIFIFLKNILKQSGLPVYDQKTHEGFFRHLVIREGVNTNQILVNLVVADKYFEITKNQKVWQQIKDSLKNNEILKEKITSFVITNNNGLADIVKGPEITTEILRGDGYIFEKLFLKKNINLEETINESTFRVSPFSFFQTNTFGAQVLFSTAINLLGNIKGNILDLYCGTGTIGLSFLKMGIGENLVGIEIVEEAIVDANKNSEINGLKDKTYFFSGSVEKNINNDNFIRNISNLGLVIIDPPREGLHTDVINYLLKLKKEYKFKLLYISCNPVTMARDVKLLIDGGMKLNILQAVDMFPQTHHIECIGILN